MDREAHILVVDDDSQVRTLLGRFLGENGYRVTGARDGREMRETLAGAVIDLIILDLMLPGRRPGSISAASCATLVVDPGDHADRQGRGHRPHRRPRGGRRRLPAEAVQPARAAGADPRRAAPRRGAGTARGGARRADDHLRRLDAGHAAPRGDVAGRRRRRPERRRVRRAASPSSNTPTGSCRASSCWSWPATAPPTRSTAASTSRSAGIRRKLESDASAPPLIKTVRGAGYIFLPTVKRC